MFKASRNLVPEQFDRLTEDVGGFNNASTNDDYTNYYEVVPANHLQRLLWAEAERMGSLVVEPGFFASERDVVKEELRSRVLAAPYGRLFYLYLPQISYDVHPYARPGIGSIEDLDAATIDDVRAFHATYYRPDNAVLVVAGNFDQAAARPLGRPIFRPDRPAGHGDPAGDRGRARAHPAAPLHGLRAQHAAARGPALLSRAAGERRGRGGDGGARRHPLDRRELAPAPDPRLSRPDRRPGQLVRRHQAGPGQPRRLRDPLAAARAPRRARRRCAARSPASATSRSPPPSWPRRRTSC